MVSKLKRPLPGRELNTQFSFGRVSLGALLTRAGIRSGIWHQPHERVAPHIERGSATGLSPSAQRPAGTETVLPHPSPLPEGEGGQGHAQGLHPVPSGGASKRRLDFRQWRAGWREPPETEERFRSQRSQCGRCSTGRHVKVRGAANPHDPAWELYFEERRTRQMAGSLTGRGTARYLWLEQDGQCLVCGQPLTLAEGRQTGKTGRETGTEGNGDGETGT
jgi:hypothetical protein